MKVTLKRKFLNRFRVFEVADTDHTYWVEINTAGHHFELVKIDQEHVHLHVPEYNLKRDRQFEFEIGDSKARVELGYHWLNFVKYKYFKFFLNGALAYSEGEDN